MPGKVKVKIIAGRNLPVMDRSSDTTDAYVEIKLGNTTYKTDVCRKSLNPQWNSEWYRFEVDDSELQDEPLQIRLMDHDTYSANDAIGKVYLNLNPLLIPAVAIPSKYGWSGDANVDQPSSSMMSGWIPVYDTMHGIRGEVNVTVKVELFSDFNKFRQSSCGVHFFCSPVIPHGYHAQVIHGFIEELVVNDDPEYQWIDKIRTPRASNEARQTLFFKLSGELQRKIGVKALDLGGNAVIGYNQCFDLEGESGIVARGIGTVVTLIKHHEMQQQLTDIGIAEEKALSYLKFLAFDNGLKLESDNKFECLSLSQPNPKPISSSLFINPPTEEQIIRRSPRRNIPLFIRQSSQPLIQLDYHSPILKPCISSQSLSDDIKEEIALRQLIQQEDMRNGSISSTSLTRRMRYLKQNILTKKMIALKAKLSDTPMPEHLDFASTSIKKETPTRSSLIDLRELRKKKKSRMHQNNSSYMAELLVRSVMHAHTSLDCILECHDTGPTLSSSTSKLNEDHGECSSMQSSESKKTVLECDPIGGLMTKTISEPYLLLPDNTIVTPVSNASSDSDVSSSSDVSESPSDSKEEKMDFDTVSLIVKNVQQEEEIREFKEKREQCAQLHFSFLDPPIHTSHIIPIIDFEADVEESSNIDESQNIESIENDETPKNIVEVILNVETLGEPIVVAIEDIQELVNIDEIRDNLEITEIKTEDLPSPLPSFNKAKLNSLFRSHALNISFDVPATAPVYLEDRKEVFTFPVDIDKKIEKLSHSALFNHSFRMHGLKRSKLQKGFSRSCEDVSAENKEENSEKTGMHLFTQTTPKDTEGTEEKRKCFAECAQQTFSQSNPNISNVGLVSTAINTMLMEKIDLMTSEPAPVSPKIKKELKAPWSHKSNAAENNSLMRTAMQTMLMEKVNLMSPVGAPVSRRVKEQLQFQSSVSKSFSKSDPDLHSHSLLKSAIHTIHKVHLPHHIFHHKTKKLQKTMSQSHPELSQVDEGENGQHSVKEKFMDKIHFLTHHYHKSKEFDHHKSKEFDHHKSKEFDHHKSEEFNHHNSKEFDHHKSKEFDHRKSKEFDHHKSKEFDHHKSKEFDHEHESNKGLSSEPKEHHTVKEKFMDKIHFITHAIPHPHHHKSKEFHETGQVATRRHTHHGKTLSTSHPDLREHHSVKEKFMDKIHFITQAMPHPHLHHHHHHHHKDETNLVKETSKSHPDLRDQEKHNHTSFMEKIHALKSPVTTPKKKKSHVLHETHSGHPSLVKTAMQTMLLDKVNILTSNSPPTSPNIEEEFQYEESSPDLQEESPTSSNGTSIKTELDLYETSTQVSELDNQSLVKTAMATMLLDKVNILTPTSPQHTEPFNFDDRKQSIKHEHLKLDKIKTVVHSVIDKVHHLTPLSPKSEKEFNFDVKKHEDNENQSLMKTAMQTMLLDKVQILNPNSPTPEFEEPFFNVHDESDKSHHHKKEDELENHSLVKTAMQTILLEKANIVAPETSNVSEMPDDSSNTKTHVEKKSFFGSLKKKCKNFKMPSPKKSFTKLIHKKDSHKSDGGLVESAMSTILLDRVNSIQGTITPHEDPPTTQTPNSSISKAFSKQTIDDLPLALPSAEEPNINKRLDNGVTYNNGTPAITSNDANCNTNAEHVPCLYTSDRRIVESPIPERETSTRERHGHQRTESTGGKMSQSPARLNAIPCIHRRSSDSDLSITPKGNSLTGSDRSGGAIPGYHHIRSTLLRPTVDNFDMMEYPFLTMSKYPPGFILHLGGAVSARSVKLLERITNIEEPETRDTWWSELRMEIRTHARALNCNAVLGYQESTSICDEVCVLSAAGTAAVIALYSGELSDGVSGLPNLHKPHIPNKDLMTSSLDRTDFERDSKITKHVESSNTNNKITESPEHEATIEFSGSTNQQTPTACRICHIPYSESSMSFRINMLYCSICKLAKVPDIILATIEMPEGLPITGRGCFLQSYVCRPKRDLKGELNAKEISESLPFLEYELHRLLVNKMKVKAMNTIFGLKVRITIGERMLVGIATGTAVFLLPLPPPPLPKLIAGNATTEDKKLSEMQKLLVDTVKKNKEIYELKDQDFLQNTRLLSDTEESDDEKSNIDLGAGNKDSCVLEVDDSEDIEVINLLVEPRPPDGFHVVNTENVPGLEELEIVRNLQMFTQVWRTKIPLNQSVSHFGKHFQKILQSVYFKLRRMIPCALCDLQFRVDLPEPDEIQLTLLGMALGLGDPMKLNKFKRKNLSILPTKELSKKSDDELIFSLEEDHIPENSVPVICQSGLLNPQVPKHRQKSPQRLRMNPKHRHTPIKERHGVDITPLSYVPGGKIERYLGYLNFFFIRETTSIREGGGLSGFVHSFITEVLAIVRAHVTALGGNAMVAYFMTECVLCHNAHKNQGQCLINVGGDVVFVSYFTEDN